MMTFPATDEHRISCNTCFIILIIQKSYQQHTCQQHVFICFLSSSELSSKSIAVEKFDCQDIFFILFFASKLRETRKNTQCVSATKYPTCTQSRRVFFSPPPQRKIVDKHGFLSPVGPDYLITQILPLRRTSIKHVGKG